MVFFKKKLCFYLITLASIAYSQTSALVLSGGGAKGSYQVGVWKAMCEYGVTNDIVVISGTSVGAINAALFASVESPDEIANFWETEICNLLKLNTELVTKSINDELKHIDATMQEYDNELQRRLKARYPGVPSIFYPKDKVESIKRKLLIEYSVRFGVDKINSFMELKRKVYSREKIQGILDPTPLQNLLDETIPQDWSNVEKTVYVTTLGENGKKVFKLNDYDHSDRILRICASWAIPIAYSTIEIDGENFVDGGWNEEGGENVPISPVVENHPEVKKIYVVHLNDKETLKKDGTLIDRSKYQNVEIIEIIPSEDLHGWFGTFDFDSSRATELINLGYKDACSILKK